MGRGSADSASLDGLCWMGMGGVGMGVRDMLAGFGGWRW